MKNVLVAVGISCLNREILAFDSFYFLSSF